MQIQVFRKRNLRRCYRRANNAKRKIQKNIKRRGLISFPRIMKISSPQNVDGRGNGKNMEEFGFRYFYDFFVALKNNLISEFAFVIFCHRFNYVVNIFCCFFSFFF